MSQKIDVRFTPAQRGIIDLLGFEVPHGPIPADEATSLATALEPYLQSNTANSRVVMQAIHRIDAAVWAVGAWTKLS